MLNSIIILSILIGGLQMQATAQDRQILTEVTVNASVSEVFEAWTTTEGIKTFFAAGGDVEAKIGGRYDIYFDPTAEPGQRGAEGMIVMSIERNKMLSFSWNQPLSIPSLREHRTLVVLKFEALGDNKTKIRFAHMGWGDGEAWDKAYQYFDSAWKQVVLPRLKYRFDHGPINWENPPPLGS